MKPRIGGWPRDYRPAWLRGDIAAGLTVGAVLIAESLAFATVAGVPPVVGLYPAVPSLLVYALVGSSRQLIVGPMSATAALSAGILADYSFNLDQHGVAIVGPIDRGLPHLGLPALLSMRDCVNGAGPAIGVLLVGFAEGRSAAKTYAAKAGHEIRPNRDLLGPGAAWARHSTVDEAVDAVRAW